MSGIHGIYKHKSPELRYNISIISMITVLISSILTFAFYYIPDPSIAQAIDLGIGNPNTIINSSEEVGITHKVFQFFSNNIYHINFIWTIGVLIFAFKMMMSYGYVKFIKYAAIDLENDSILSTVSRIKKATGVQKFVRIAESARINVPMVMGHFKPIILFPIGMVNELNPMEIEAIIIHELTHIKRNDYLMNIGLSILEILFYYHPAMWWISANVKAERENCCDDAAINHNIDSVTYAKALVKLEEMRKSGIPALAMPFASNKHQLLNRVKRILNMEQTKSDIREKSVATLMLLFVAILFASNTIIPPNEDSDKIDEITHVSLTDTVKISGEDEIIVEVEKGIFSSLKVDGKKVNNGKMVTQLKDLFSRENLTESNNHDQRFYMKGSPTLEFENRSFILNGDESYIQFLPLTKKIEQDSLPQKLHLDQDHVTIIVEKNGQRIEVQKENGKTIGLKIDGKEIPENEFDQYEDQIEAATKNFSFKKGNFNVFEFDNDFDGQFEFENLDSMLSHSFGMMFDGENWKGLGGNMEEFLDEELIDKLKELEIMRPLEGLDNLKRLEEIQEMEGFKQLEKLDGLEGLEDLQEMLDGLGIQMDSTMRMFKLDSNDWEDFRGFDGFEFFSDENMDIRDSDDLFGSNTVVDRIGRSLNKDGLLREYKSNKIEITGKHLKINGEKMPKALFNKYKDIYQEATGAPLTKKSKMVFDIEGKPSKRKVRSF